MKIVLKAQLYEFWRLVKNLQRRPVSGYFIESSFCNLGEQMRRWDELMVPKRKPILMTSERPHGSCKGRKDCSPIIDKSLNHTGMWYLKNPRMPWALLHVPGWELESNTLDSPKEQVFIRHAETILPNLPSAKLLGFAPDSNSKPWPSARIF